MKKLFTNLFTVILFLLFATFSMSAQNVEIGYGAGTAWPAVTTVNVNQSFNLGTANEFYIASDLGSVKSASICGTSSVLHYELGGTGYYVEGKLTINSVSSTITSIRFKGSTNGSAAAAAGVVYSSAYPFDANAVVGAVSASFPASSGVWTNIDVTPPANAKSFRIYRRIYYNSTTGKSQTTSGTGFVQYGDNTTIRVAYVGVWIVPGIPTIANFIANGITATINESSNPKTITAVLPYGTNLATITPIVTIGGTATAYSPTTAQDFSGGAVNYTATDGTNNSVYAVTLTDAAAANSDATLSDLKVDGTSITGFNAATLSYDVVLPYVYSGLPVITSTVNAVTSSQVISQVSAIPGSATVTVTAQDNSQKIYTVNFTRTPIATGNDITSFTINGKAGVFTGQNILVQMHLTTNVTSLTPTVVVSTLATYTPAGVQDFTSPVNYVVTAQDGTQKTYTVTVQLVDLSYTGPYPYSTNFPSGYVIPAWMSSPTGGIVFTDPYTGSDKALWYDNATETTAGTVSVIRFNSATSMEILVSQCGTVTAKVSATGSRTYNLYINGTLANTAAGTTNTMSTLTASPNLSTPTTIRIENPATSGGITLGYLEIDAPVATGISQTKLMGVSFDGQIIHNNANLDLQVFDMTGRLLISSNKDISMSASAKGIYIVKNPSGTLKIVL